MISNNSSYMQADRFNIFSDGGCRGNPGLGSWAFAVYFGATYKGQKSDAVEHTTNNQMELEAVIKALGWVNRQKATLGKHTITIYTDSNYVQQGYKNWLGNWVKRNWRTAKGEPVKNQDQWKKVASLKLKLANRVRIEKVPAHSGVEGNEMADSLCNQRMDEWGES